jgi:hypothetical protein
MLKEPIVNIPTPIPESKKKKKKKTPVEPTPATPEKKVVGKDVNDKDQEFFEGFSKVSKKGSIVMKQKEDAL